MANIGDAAEGAFAISLALFVLENDQIKSNSRLYHSVDNIKYWMKQIDPKLFVTGGTYSKQLYNGYATLASKVGKKATSSGGNITPKNSKTIPYDIADVSVQVSLKAEAVKDFFGKEFKDVTLDGIIRQMVTNSGRYKEQINSYKTKFMTNDKAEYFKILISTIGKEGEQSGGAIKGDIQMEMSIQPVDISTRKPIGTLHKRKFPMYFSLKASGQPPKTISNESPITSLTKLSESFGVNVINSKYNQPISRLPEKSLFTTTAKKQRQQWEISLFGNGGLGRTGKMGERYMIVGGQEYSVSDYRVFDLIDPAKFPALKTARTAGDKVWKSLIIQKFVEAVFSLFPSGSLDKNQSSLVWKYLFESAFGTGDYASQTMLLAFGQKTYQSSSLDYVRAVQEATENSIFCQKTGDNISFYVGSSINTNAKLFHIRYKNRTSYAGDIGANRNFNLEDVVKLELKIMPETGPAFKEKSDWKPGVKLNFKKEDGSLTIKKE
jgi:hypothetical protein